VDFGQLFVIAVAFVWSAGFGIGLVSRRIAIPVRWLLRAWGCSGGFNALSITADGDRVDGLPNAVKQFSSRLMVGMEGSACILPRNQEAVPSTGGLWP